MSSPNATQEPTTPVEFAHEPQIRSFPIDSRRRPSTIPLLTAGLLGLSAVTLAVLSIFGPSRSEALASGKELLDVNGVMTGHLFVAGAVLIGVSLVGRYLASLASALLDRGPVEDALMEVGADLAEFQAKLSEFQADHLHFRTVLDQTKIEIAEHHGKDRSAEAQQALFGIAGSLDTLHAKLEGRMIQTSEAVESTMHQLGGLIEESRDYLQDSLEASDERLIALTAQLLENKGDAFDSSEEADETEDFEPETEALEESAYAHSNAEPDLGVLDQIPSEEPPLPMPPPENHLARMAELVRSESDGDDEPEGLSPSPDPNPPSAS